MLLLLIMGTLAGPAFAEDEAPPAPDPAASPISIPMSPDNPGPFKCKVDPYVVVRQGESVDLAVLLTVEEGTKLYKDQIAVTVAEPGGLSAGALVLPVGQPHTDPWGGPEREVYSADTRFSLPLTAPADLSGRVDLTVEVSWQGCSDKACFMPGYQTFNVPVRVKKGR